MNTAIATSTGENTGVGFAIPVDTIRRVMAALIRDGRVVRPSLGVAAYIQSPDGLVVGQLVPGGPAEQAGLRGVRIIRRRTYFGEQRQVDIDYADVILAVEGKPVKSMDDLMSVVETMQPGQQARLTVRREGAAVPVLVTLGNDSGE
jgi:S1-C subfamily serine protease